MTRASTKPGPKQPYNPKTATMLPEAIHATVHADAVNRVSEFFNATPTDILREVFQNARRARATRIDVTTEEPGVVRIDDNGHGIADPTVLLAFGRSQWDKREHEEPAGMGMYALANSTCTITSKSELMEHGWRVTLEPDHYRGLKHAKVIAEPAVTRRGTSISIKSNEHIGHAMRECARFLPIEVWWNGKRTEQDRFRDSKQTVSVNEDDDLSLIIDANWYFGDYTTDDKKKMSAAFVTRINFHGHVISDHLQMPVVNGIHHYWNARIEVHKCPSLKLVLPARKEVVRTPFLAELRHRVEKAIYEAIEKCAPDDPRARLSHESWTRAYEVLGRKLPQPPIELPTWSPSTPENRLEREQTPRETLKPETTNVLVVPTLTTAPVQVMLQHAIDHDQSTNLKVYEADDRYAGFTRYKALPQIREVTVESEQNAPGTERKANATAEPLPFVKRIRLRVATETLGGNTGEVVLETNMAFETQERDGYPHSPGMMLTAENQPPPQQIEERIMTAFYEDSNNGEDSDTQREKFREEIQKMLEKVLLGEKEAFRRTVHRALDDNIGRRLKHRGTIIIRYDPNGSCAIVDESQLATN